MEVTNSEYQEIMGKDILKKDLAHLPGSEHLCPIKDIVARFGDKWSLHTILYLGQHEKLRFNELKAKIEGISQRMLTVTLRALEEDGLVARKVYSEIPPKVEYQLTPLGQSLLLELLKLSDWARVNRDKVLVAREQYARKEQR